MASFNEIAARLMVAESFIKTTEANTRIATASTSGDSKLLAGQPKTYYKCEGGCSWTCSGSCTSSCVSRAG